MNKNIQRMKVLNIAQPNAHYVMFNGKNVENRSKDARFRGTIAIYASKTVDQSRFEGSEKYNVKESDCALGCIVGFVDIVNSITAADVSKKTEEWFSGPYGYVFENIIPLKKPIEVSPPKGAVIWWTLGGSELQKCLDQISKNVLENMNPVPCDPPKAKSNKPRARRVREEYDEEAAPLLKISSPLTVVTGLKQAKSGQIIQALWKYVQDNQLQDSKKKNIVHCDEKLRKVFGKDKVYISEIPDLLEDHLQEVE